MSGKRDWDKARRNRQAYQNGTLPAWSDGWAAGEPWEPAAPSIATRRSRATEKIALRDIDGTEIPVISSWSKSAEAHVKALGLTGSAGRKRVNAILQRRGIAKTRAPQASEKRTLQDIDGTEIPVIGSWSKSARAHVNALGLTGSAGKKRLNAILQWSATGFIRNEKLLQTPKLEGSSDAKLMPIEVLSTVEQDRQICQASPMAIASLLRAITHPSLLEKTTTDLPRSLRSFS
jgi:hypothetical protein